MQNNNKFTLIRPVNNNNINFTNTFHNLETFDFETIIIKQRMIPILLTYTDKNVVNTVHLCPKDYNAQKIEKELDQLNPYNKALECILTNFKEGYIYYAHNLIFDFAYIILDLLKNKIKFNWFFIDYDLYSVRIAHGKKKIEFRCSFKFLPFALKDLYPSITNYSKLYFPYNELKIWNPSKKLNKYFNKIDEIYHKYSLGEYYLIYAQYDCIILKDALTQFWNTLKQINILYTPKIYSIGGIALNFFIQNWNNIKFTPQKYVTSLRTAYFGGRCEVFGNPLNNEKILHYDFTGMYRQCMLEQLPYGNLIFENYKNLQIDEPGFYYIKINTVSNFPVLPIKNNKLYFLNGIIEGLYWWEEILCALQYTKIYDLKIYWRYRAIGYDYYLKDFISSLTVLKTRGHIYNKISKLLINSFYGRLALNDYLNIIKIVNITENEYMLYNDIILKAIKKHKPAKTNIAVAAAITAKARIKLYKAYMDVISGGGRLLYSDTDSIFAAFPSQQNIENKQLGSIMFDTSKNKNIYSDAVFLAPKSYALKHNNLEIIKIKGINSNNFTFDFIKKKFYENAPLYAEINIISFNKFNYKIKKKEITINNTEYKKRKWSVDRKNTYPITKK